MPNGLDHRVFAAASIGGVAMADWKEGDHWTKHPVLAAATAGACGTLPDVLEPAVHPHHRQFFHSLLFAGGVGFALFKLYKWEPETDGARILRALALAGGGAYLVHLVMDSLTRRSLPLIGKL